MSKKRKERFHTDFSRENTRHRNNPNAIKITSADLYFLQALGRIQ